MTQENLCVGCGRPTPDGVACSHCAHRAGDRLHEIADMTPAARDIAHGIASHGGGGASGKPGSRLPLDLGATSKLDAVEARFTRWSRQIAAERGIAPPWLTTYGDPITAASSWLSGHVEWIRHRGPTTNPTWLTAIYGPPPWPDHDQPPVIAAEFLDAVDACHRVVRGLARGPAEQKYLGPCGAIYVCDAACDHERPDETHEAEPCHGDVYAYRGARAGRCKTCGTEVATSEREAWLDGEVRSHAFRASEIANAYGVNVKTIRTWHARGLLAEHGHTSDGTPQFNVGDVLDLAAADAARRETDRAKRERRKATKTEEDAA